MTESNPETPELEFDQAGEAFRLKGDQWRSLDRRPVLRRLFLTLIRYHQSDPGRFLTTDQLVAEVWPQEQFADKDSPRNRLWVLLSKLRREGLAGILEKEARGYRLTPWLLVHVGRAFEPPRPSAPPSEGLRLV